MAGDTSCAKVPVLRGFKGGSAHQIRLPWPSNAGGYEWLKDSCVTGDALSCWGPALVYDSMSE